MSLGGCGRLDRLCSSTRAEPAGTFNCQPVSPPPMRRRSVTPRSRRLWSRVSKVCVLQFAQCLRHGAAVRDQPAKIGHDPIPLDVELLLTFLMGLHSVTTFRLARATAVTSFLDARMPPGNLDFK